MYRQLRAEGFRCTRRTVEKLMREMQESKAGMKPFEALVRVKIARGVPLETELVAVRPR